MAFFRETGCGRNPETPDRAAAGFSWTMFPPGFQDEERNLGARPVPAKEVTWNWWRSCLSCKR